MANIRGKAEIVTDFFFLDSKITVDSHCSHKIRRQLLLGQKVIANLDSVLKGRDITVGKGQDSQSYGLPCGHIWLWELDCKEGRLPKNWCLQTVVLEKTPESPLDSKELKPVNLKGDQPWIFTERIDAETEAPVFWSPDVNRRLTGKAFDAGKYWGQKKGASEDEMARWHYRWTWTWANSGRW